MPEVRDWDGDSCDRVSAPRGVLRDGGQLVAQCGGQGNVTRVHGAAAAVAAQPPFAEHFRGWSGPWSFSSPEQAQRRLLRAGFAQARCWLEPAPAQPPQPREFLRTVLLGPHLQQLPAELREPFTAAVHERLGEPLSVDYVRLNIDATA